jgi:hypothetical protein
MVLENVRANRHRPGDLGPRQRISHGRWRLGARPPTGGDRKKLQALPPLGAKMWVERKTWLKSRVFIRLWRRESPPYPNVIQWFTETIPLRAPLGAPLSPGLTFIPMKNTTSHGSLPGWGGMRPGGTPAASAKVARYGHTRRPPPPFEKTRPPCTGGSTQRHKGSQKKIMISDLETNHA